jgi:glycosyltransferase involved in cell wall biosynthesis
VSLEGWSLSRALRDHADTHVVTHVRNRDDIAKSGWSEGREFTVLDPAAVEGPITRVGEAVRNLAKLGWTWSTVLTTFWYYYFEHLAWRRFGGAIRNGEFDVVHRLNPVTPPTPSLIAQRCRDAGVPFVWGPINGGVPWPKEFRDAMYREGEWLSHVRGAYKLLPGYRATRRSAKGLIVGSVSVWDQMQGYRDRCVYIPENAIDPSRFTIAEPASSKGPLRVAFVGRLVPYKGADILIDAVAPLVRAGRVVVEIIGDGPDMPRIR